MELTTGRSTVTASSFSITVSVTLCKVFLVVVPEVKVVVTVEDESEGACTPFPL